MKKLFKLLTIMLLVAPISALAGSYTEVNAEDLLKLKSSENVVIVDTRSKKYMSDKVIEGAELLSTTDLSAETLSKIASKEDKIVFYCSNTNCPASAKAAAKAASLGFKNLYKYPGGIDDWVEKGLPVKNI